jgi:hypothetical protein
MESVFFTETVLVIYQTTHYHNAEDNNSNSNMDGTVYPTIGERKKSNPCKYERS